MTKSLSFFLDGRQITAQPEETIWQAAKRHGVEIAHLCWLDQPGYRADGNCRACMVEIEGERVLAASCIRKPQEGMKVCHDSARARKAREMVFELLRADQPEEAVAHDSRSAFWRWAKKMQITDKNRFPAKMKQPGPDRSLGAIAVNLDACIHCNLCVRACQDVQGNDVIGLAYRGGESKIVFDFDDEMGKSTCVACGECVQACPTGALMESSLLNEHEVRTEFPQNSVDSLCPYCGVGCQTRVHVKENKIISVEGRNGPANAGRLCVKGRFGFDYIHHRDRLRTPLLRREGVGKSGDMQIDLDCLDQYFRPASWEEALCYAADGLRSIRDQAGGDAIAGFGSAKCSNEEAYLFQKLIRQGFGTNNVDHCTRLCHASSVAALMEGLNSGAVSAPFTAAKDADCMIIIGARPNENHPVAASFIKNAARNGAELIIMDPRGQNQGLARYASHVLQFTAGRDVALLNAILHVIINDGLTDRQYIQANATGFDELVRNVAAYAPEKVASICGVAAPKIRQIAHIYAKAQASLIFWGMGISQHIHGTDNARCLIAMALITGQIGRKGTGLHPLRGQNNVQGASDAGLIPMAYPDYQPAIDPTTIAQYSDFWQTPLSNKPGLTVVEIMHAIAAGKVRGMYILGENPAMSDPDQKHARAALAKLEHLVVQDIFLTETAWHADVILPASSHGEKWGSYTNTNREIQIGRPAVAMPEGVREDWVLIQEIAKRIGLDWRYTHPKEVFAEMAQIMDSLKNISWERLEREDSVTYPCDAPDKPGNAIIFTDGFPTKDGKGKIVPVRLTAPAEEPDVEYPLVLSTGRLLEHWHTGAMTRRAEQLDMREPEAVACLNQRDLGQLDIAPGNLVRVVTRRGEITLKARLDPDVPAGMVFVPFCFAEAPANFLTNPQLDPVGKIPEFKYCAARIEKIAPDIPAKTV